MCVLLGWHESLASSQSMKCQCQQQSERSPDWKGETKACNFSLPDILAIIILSHLLKTKWFLSCRKGQNVVVSVPSEEVISFPERWETAWGRWPRLAPSQGLGLGHADDLCHSLLIRLIWILHMRTIFFLWREKSSTFTTLPCHGMTVPRLMQVFPSLLWNFPFCF